MKHITLKIPDHKLLFFMELIKNLGFIEVEKEPEHSNDEVVFSQEEKDELDRRVKIAKDSNFENCLSREDFDKQLNKEYGI